MPEEPIRRVFCAHAARVAAGTIASVWAPGVLAASAASAPPLPRRVLGKTNVAVPILGLGADGLVTDSTNPEQVARFLHAALDPGITVFDAAHAYGKDGQSEKNLGLLTGKARRPEVFLATKTGSRSDDGASGR